MPIQLDVYFWVSVAITFVAIRLPFMQAGSRFGALNLSALAVLLGGRIALAIMALAALLWLVAWAMGRLQDRAADLLFAATLGAMLLLFSVSKYLFELRIEGVLDPRAAAAAKAFELIAYSYFFLRAWDMLNAIRSGARLIDPLALSGFLAPFFMIPAGPINVYAAHLAFAAERTLPAPSIGRFMRAVETIVTGLFVKFVLAELLRLWVAGASGDWPTTTLAGSAVTFLYIYLDFAGYSAVALGIGMLLGVPTPRNFRRPFLAASLTDFWTRWHISLGDWLKRNLYFPIQLSLMRRTGGQFPVATATAGLVGAFTFAGLWHRMTAAFLAWGILFGILLSLEKFVRDRWWSSWVANRPELAVAARWIGPVYVCVTVIVMLHLTAMGQMVGNDR